MSKWVPSGRELKIHAPQEVVLEVWSDDDVHAHLEAKAEKAGGNTNGKSSGGPYAKCRVGKGPSGATLKIHVNRGELWIDVELGKKQVAQLIVALGEAMEKAK